MEKNSSNLVLFVSDEGLDMDIHILIMQLSDPFKTWKVWLDKDSKNILYYYTINYINPLIWLNI